MKQLKEKIAGFRVKTIVKWVLLTFIGFITMRGCVNGCSNVITTEETSSVTDTTKVNPQMRLIEEVRGDLSCAVEYALEESAKYLEHRNVRELPTVDAVAWYIEGRVLDAVRSIQLNEEVLDTMDFQMYQDSVEYKKLIRSQIIIE